MEDCSKDSMYPLGSGGMEADNEEPESLIPSFSDTQFFCWFVLFSVIIYGIVGELGLYRTVCLNNVVRLLSLLLETIRPNLYYMKKYI